MWQPRGRVLLAASCLHARACDPLERALSSQFRKGCLAPELALADCGSHEANDWQLEIICIQLVSALNGTKSMSKQRR